jgi:hypothetical protein
MIISSYEDLLAAAKQQPEPQRLLFVFTQVELPAEHTSAEAEQFHAGQGGNLVPVFCVDIALDELGSFADLAAESKQTGQDWKVVFVACLDGKNGVPLSSSDAEMPLQIMQTNILSGMIDRYLAYDREGHQIRFG